MTTCSQSRPNSPARLLGHESSKKNLVLGETPGAVRGSVAALSLLKLLATLSLLFSREPAAEAAEPPRPRVGVPFGCGLAFEVSQAHNTGSHLNNDVYAWDFRMPEGVPIVAARGGVVRMARGDSTVGGCDPRFAKDANYVVIDHGDGTEAQYLHFSSVTVEAGQKVNAGELIGYSGKTGWACGSHLHFKVARRVHNGWNNPSIPAEIEGFGDPDVRTVVAAPSCTTKAPVAIQADVSDGRTPSTTQIGASSPGQLDEPLPPGSANDKPAVRGPAGDRATAAPTSSPVEGMPGSTSGRRGDRAAGSSGTSAAR